MVATILKGHKPLVFQSHCIYTLGMDKIYLCNSCGEMKNYSEFTHPHKTCKVCRVAVVMKWQKDNPEYVSAYRKAHRRSLEQRRKSYGYYREWYRKNGRKRNSKQILAHTAVASAIRTGGLVRPDKCTECDRTTRIEAHHDNYSKPLDVLWLCNHCHRSKHPGVKLSNA